MNNIIVTNKRWNDLVNLITPLDLVLFEGKDLVSSTIKTLQNKKLRLTDISSQDFSISHVGIVVSALLLPHLKELDPNEFYVWESTSSLRLPGFDNEVPDVFGKHKLGVQIRNLKKVIEVYNGNVYIAKLKKNPLYMNNSFPNNDKLPKSNLSVEFEKIIDNLKNDFNKIDLSENIIDIDPQTISNDFDSIIDDINKGIQQFDEQLSYPQNDFDFIIDDINKGIRRFDQLPFTPPAPAVHEDSKLASKEMVEIIDNVSSDLQKINHSLFDSIDISTNFLIAQMNQTIREINKNIDETIDLANVLEKDIDDTCKQFNQMIYEKLKQSKEYKHIVKEIRYIYESYGNRIYNSSFLDLLSALYPFLRPFRNLKYKILRKISHLFKSKKIQQESLFCSQFVAIIYSRFNIIDRSIDVKNFVPIDFLGYDEDGQKNIVNNIFKIIK